MSSAAGLAIMLFIVLSTIFYERNQKTTFCLTALKRSGFADVIELRNHTSSGSKQLGASTFQATLAPFEDAKAARIEVVFESSSESPHLNTRSKSSGLNNASATTLGWGEECWSVTLHEALHCLGTPTPSRFEEIQRAFFFDIDEIATTDTNTTIRATAFTSHSAEYERRVQAMGLRERISAPANDDSNRSKIVSSALDAVVEFAHAIDGATRRHADGPPPAFWRRAWRGTKRRDARAQAITILARVIGEDALWAEALAIKDPLDLTLMWHRDPERALSSYGTRERALLLGDPRIHAPELHDALLEEITPDWLDALDWREARPILAIMRKKFGAQNLTSQLSRLSRRISDTQRAELVSALGPDAEVLMARGGLSLSEDDASRGGLSRASHQGGLSEVE